MSSISLIKNPMTRQKITQPSCNQLTNGNYQIKQKNATLNMRVRERETHTHTRSPQSVLSPGYFGPSRIHKRFHRFFLSIGCPLLLWNARPQSYSKVKAYKVQKVLKLIASIVLNCNCDIMSIFPLTPNYNQLFQNLHQIEQNCTSSNCSS